MSPEVVDLNANTVPSQINEGEGVVPLGEYQELQPEPPIASQMPENMEQSIPTEPIVDTTRLGSLLEAEALPSPDQPSPLPLEPESAPVSQEMMGAIDREAQEIKAPEGFGGVPLGVVAPVDASPTGPVAPEEQQLHRRSRILHIFLSLLVVIFVVGGAAIAAYWYSSSGATFVKLPKLPFIKEPESAPEVVENSGDESKSGDATANQTESEKETATSTPAESTPPSGVEGSKGGLTGETTIDTSSWKTFKSNSWGFSFKYPDSWYLYPRDTGSPGEATMVASSPLPSLDNDLRKINVASSDVAIGMGVLEQNVPEGQTVMQFLQDNATQLGISPPEETMVAGDAYLRSLSTQGGVLNYYRADGRNKNVIFFISIKPSDFSATHADNIGAVVGSFEVSF